MFFIFHKIPYQEQPHPSCWSEPRAPWWGIQEERGHFPPGASWGGWGRGEWQRHKRDSPSMRMIFPFMMLVTIKLTPYSDPRRPPILRMEAGMNGCILGPVMVLGNMWLSVLHSQQEWPWYCSYPSTRSKLLTILREQSIRHSYSSPAITLLSMRCPH